MISDLYRKLQDLVKHQINTVFFFIYQLVIQGQDLGKPQLFATNNAVLTVKILRNLFAPVFTNLPHNFNLPNVFQTNIYTVKVTDKDSTVSAFRFLFIFKYIFVYWKFKWEFHAYMELVAKISQFPWYFPYGTSQSSGIYPVFPSFSAKGEVQQAVNPGPWSSHPNKTTRNETRIMAIKRK